MDGRACPEALDTQSAVGMEGWTGAGQDGIAARRLARGLPRQ